MISKKILDLYQSFKNYLLSKMSEIRKPKEILKIMDKNGVRNDQNLLIQLNAELLVSLSLESEKVSRRNLAIAKISCIVAVIALIISGIQVIGT
ncbi:hypothetical protein NIES970_23610 [[Synechococcus] sp. NIES-970]|nr:hypothetical protein NIES970_23610 [[Synechococcus] sp. NIES-970]